MNLQMKNILPTIHVWMTEFYMMTVQKVCAKSQIINEGLNIFKGMKCHLGFESLNIDANGDIYSSWCGAVNFGNISIRIGFIRK